ncbi:NfeD family protein, partial [Rosenbergiella nectarea]
MAIAALVPAVISYYFPELAVITQLLTWTFSSLICAFIWIKWIRSKPAEHIETVLIGNEGV